MTIETTVPLSKLPRRLVAWAAAGGLLMALAACAPKEEEAAAPAAEPPAPASIALTPLTGSPTFPDAKLTLNSPEAGSDVAGPTVPFDFTVENYDLGVQTADAMNKGIANSDKGQHIHLILNDGPYTAHYEPTFESAELDPGHYVALAFLSRSYHESVKAPGAYVLTDFTVGGAERPADLDLSGPQLFYSRPKGTYSGPDTEKVMLDFFLVNADLSPDGYKVKATINGQESTLDNWQPYLIDGLPKGEATIHLQLIDAAGNVVPGPYNDVTRTITLE